MNNSINTTTRPTVAPSVDWRLMVNVGNGQTDIHRYWTAGDLV